MDYGLVHAEDRGIGQANEGPGHITIYIEVDDLAAYLKKIESLGGMVKAIEAGVDIIHPIQALSAGMEPERLRADFGNRVSFCGGVDAQQLLVNGSPDQVRAKVRELKRLFPTGLILSPSHEAILKDTRPENIEALFETVRE